MAAVLKSVIPGVNWTWIVLMTDQEARLMRSPVIHVMIMMVATFASSGLAVQPGGIHGDVLAEGGFVIKNS